jgi:hypothetical protein
MQGDEKRAGIAGKRLFSYSEFAGASTIVDVMGLTL